VDPSLGIGSTKISSIDGMVLMFVPAGNFLMGSDKISDSPNTDTTDELPQHTVFLDAFWIDQTLVTNGMYARCFAAGSCTAPALTSSSTTRPDYYGNSLYADYPVIHVEWNQANAYCQWAGRQLPTEAQWEKAARGTDGRIYPWGNQAPDATRANFNNNVGDTTKVGSYPAGASPYGALDMAGNVWEFVLDWYSKTYYQQSPSSNPAGPSSGNRYVLRGGSLEDDGGLIRSAFRNNYPPHWGLPFFRGFRCAASP
jgi:formylglycine-generating enzyme required for sulfatase activity